MSRADESAREICVVEPLPITRLQLAAAMRAYGREVLEQAAQLAEKQYESFKETLETTTGSEGSTQILRGHMGEAIGLALAIRKLGEKL